MQEAKESAIKSTLKIKKSINISSIVTMYYYDFTANYRSGREYHDFWEFVYVDNGHVIATADDNTYEINKGEMIFHKPNEIHSVKCDGVTPANIFIMTFVCTSPAMKFFNNKIIGVPYHLQGILAAIVEEMQAAYGENPGCITEHPAQPLGAEQVIKNYLELFLILLRRSAESTGADPTYAQYFYHEKTARSKMVMDVINILESRVYDTVTIDELCSATNYGKSHLCELFKSVTGKTVMQYYAELRIREAKMLMREQRMNNSQISDTLMFSSPQYFTRVFKQVTGMTPGEYKKSVRYR